MKNYAFFRSLLFRLSAESAHNFTLSSLKLGMKLPLLHKWLQAEKTKLPKTVAGIPFPNPVGLAAGLDKNAEYFEELGKLGFGFVEIGTVTPRPQPGNPKPRLFRLPKDQAIINRMGFNNDGVDVVAERLAHREESDLIIGGNIGKNKDTPNELAHEDYLTCFSKLFNLVDYFVINVSSPNTPGLRELQGKEGLQRILHEVQTENFSMKRQKPVFLKIAPDLSNEQLDEVVDIALLNKIAGIVATNTTISREGLQTDSGKVNKMGEGGLSGKPLTNRATTVLSRIYHHSHGKLAIIASGGIMTPSDAKNKFAAGANLVELYTGFIYQGPKLIQDILDQLR